MAAKDDTDDDTDLGVPLVVEADEGESAAAARAPLSGQVDVPHLAETIEQRLQVLAVGITSHQIY